MIRLKSAILAALILSLACAPLPAQKPGDDARWAALNKEMNAAYEKKDWTASLSVLAVALTVLLLKKALRQAWGLLWFGSSERV